MPIYEYTCPVGHETEILLLKQSDKEPKTCSHNFTRIQERTQRTETYLCGLPLEKKVSVGSWAYARGSDKNKNWPLD